MNAPPPSKSVMLGSTGVAHKENPHRNCSATAQPQKSSKYVQRWTKVFTDKPILLNKLPLI